MSRWFRHYAGMSRDDKLVRAAVKARQPVERAVWVYGAILETAAEINDAGRYDFDVDEAAYFLRCEPSDLSSILDALRDLGRIDSGKVTKWGDRQFESDGSKERQQRYRDRQKASQERNSDVTPSSRDGEVTPQETEADTEAKTKRSHPPATVPEPVARALFDEVWKAFPQNPTSSEAKAEKAFNATKASDRPLILAAALRRRQWFVEDCEARKRTEDEGLKFEPHLSTWISGGDWRKAAELPLRADAEKPDPNLAVVDAGSNDHEALKRYRVSVKRPAPYVSERGKITVPIAELTQARAGA